MKLKKYTQQRKPTKSKVQCLEKNTKKINNPSVKLIKEKELKDKQITWWMKRMGMIIDKH